MKKIKRVLFMGLFAAMMAGLCACSFGMKTNYIYDNGDKYTAGDREIKEKIEKIDIDYLSGDIKLTGTSSETVSIKETAKKNLSDKQKVHTWVDGTTLYVRYCASEKKLGLNNLEKKLEIAVPDGLKLSEFKLGVSSGDADCSGFLADSVKLDASSGDIVVGCAAKSVTANASSGDITLNLTGEADEVKAEASSGEISVNIEQAAKLDAQTSSGRITVNANSIKEVKLVSSSGSQELKVAQSPVSTDLEASSGDVTVYLPENVDVTASFDTSSGDLYYEQSFAKNGDSYVCGNGANHMTIETSSGDITIRK